jgi:hypothetical protein
MGVDSAQGQLGSMTDDTFFVRQCQDKPFDGGWLSDRAQPLGCRLTHIAVGVRKQRQQGLRYLRIAQAAEELHSAAPDLEAWVSQQAQKVVREGRVDAFGEDFDRRQADVRFRVPEKPLQFRRDLPTGVFAESMNR